MQKLLREQGVRYVGELGRGEATLIGGSRSEPDEMERADEPRHARAALAALERAHAASERNGVQLDEAARERLELLLAELLQLKGRLRATR